MRNLTRTLAAVLMALVFSVQSSFAETILSGDTNLAIGKTATASSTEGGRSAAAAIDGQETATEWGPNYNAEGEKDGSWWKLNLGSAQAFTTIRIFYNNQAPKKAKIEISTDDTNWTEVAQVGSDYGNASDNATYIYKVGHRNAQYIRITCIEGGAYGMGFNEFEVYNHNYYLTAITVSPSVVNKFIASNITITGTDSDGDNYYGFTPTGATTGTVINATNASQGLYNIVFNTSAIGDSETITATDSYDNTKTATTTIGVQAPVFTSILGVNDNAKKDFVSTGDRLELRVYDQFGGEYALAGLTLNATAGTLTADGNTLVYIVPEVENGGTITLSVSDGVNTLTHNLYMLGSNLPAPRTPTDVYKPVITVFDNADSHIHFTYGTDGTVVDETAYTPDGKYVRRIIQDKSIVVGRHNTDVFPASNASGQIYWNPVANGASELKADIFSAHAGNQVWFNIEGGSTTTPVTLNEGWNTIEWDCSAFNSNITAIRVESKRADDTYPDILITNMYFAAPQTTISKIQGTVDKEGTTDKDIAEQIFEINATTTTKPVFTIIDVHGNTVAEDTEGLNIKYVVLENPAGIINTEGLSTVAVEGMGNKPYNTTGAFPIATDQTGTAVIRIIATYKNGVGGVAVGHYGISVYDPNLTISTFTVTVSAGGNTYDNIKGSHGQLKDLINGCLTGNTYLDVTDIAVEGTLDSRDLRTLREMGGVKFNVTTNSKGFTNEQMAAHPYYFENDAHLNDYRGGYKNEGGEGTQGNLHTLNLANATFTVVSMEDTKAAYNNDEGWANLSEAQRIELNQKDNILVTLPVETVNGGWDFVDWRNTGNLHNINQFAFMGCVNLEEVTLPSTSNLMIGMHAFEHCENLQKVNNMDKVTWFGDYCFNQDKSLVGGNSANVSNQSCVEFSSALTYIGYVAFQNCENMKLYSRHLPDNINHIGDQAFASCKGFDSYIVYPNNPSLDIAHMATGVFLNCSNLQQVYIPSTTVTFGYVEFQGCTSLTDVNFYNAAAPAWTDDAVTNEKPTDINQEAYSANLVNVIANAFDGCVVLKDENFQRLYNTKLIGSAAFANCEKMSNGSFEILIKHFCDGNDQDNKAVGNGKVLSNEASLCDYTLPYRAFNGCIGLTTVDFDKCDNNVVRIDDEAFNDCSNITTVTLPAALTSMGDIVFANCTKLQTVTVQNPVAPTMDHETLTYEVTVKNELNQDVQETRQANIFLHTPSQKVEIIFPEALKTANDASGYKTYRANAHFMNAMTRTVNDSGTSYEVAPQFGGDFKLTRSFTEGWNTLALPFGSPATGKDVNGVAKFKAAFENANFDHISTYRGRKGDTFMFLKMDDEDALADFEPVMVKLTNAVTSEITFTDVDINYNHSTKALIQPNEMTVNTVSLPSDDYSSVGQLAGLADDFKFTGTYQVLLNASKEDMTYIKDGDFIIQTNNGVTTFVKCESGKRYGLKAFRGWFQANNSNARTTLMNIMDFNAGEDVANEIGTIDMTTGDITTTPQDIYTINGQLVRKGATSTNGLSKGIYIMGGRKVVVK